MPCIVLAVLLMAVIASPMAGIVLQMQGPAILASMFDTESESESEEGSSTDASDFSDFLSRPRERNRRQDARRRRRSDSERSVRTLPELHHRAQELLARDICSTRQTPLRC